MNANLRGSENIETAPPTPGGGAVVVGYLAAVSTATICFGIFEIGIVLWEESLRGLGSIVIVAFAAMVFWIVAFVTASLPVALAYLVARLLRIRSIFYYLLCGAVTGAALAPIFVWFDWHEDAAAFIGEWLRDAPLFTAMGACAAATFWSIAGRYIRLEPYRSVGN